MLDKMLSAGEDTARIEAIYRTAIHEHTLLRDIPPLTLKQIIAAELHRIGLFEKAAHEDELGHMMISREMAQNIGAVWAIAGTGTYREPVTIVDNPLLRDKPWAMWMDKHRIDRAVGLIKQLTVLRTEVATDLESAIAENGPYFIYNGYNFQNAVLEEVITHEALLPKAKVRIISGDLKITVDQIKSFALPSDKALKGKGIAIVSHAPHLCRIVHMIERYQPFPVGTPLYLFPLPTPDLGKDEFSFMEIKGLLYYIFVAKDASEEAYPYRIFPFT